MWIYVSPTDVLVIVLIAGYSVSSFNFLMVWQSLSSSVHDVKNHYVHFFMSHMNGNYNKF